MASGTPHILILRTGHTDSSVIARHGDYDAWFTSAMAGTGCRFTLRHVPLEGVGSTDRFDGILDNWVRAYVRGAA